MFMPASRNPGIAPVCPPPVETQADCLKMIVRAEMRMADEIDASGEFQHGGDRARSDAPTLKDAGVSKQQVHDFRKVRDAGVERVDAAIDRAVEEGRSPSKAEIMVSKLPVSYLLGRSWRAAGEKRFNFRVLRFKTH